MKTLLVSFLLLFQLQLSKRIVNPDFHDCFVVKVFFV